MKLRFILILFYILFLLPTRAQNDSTKNEVVAFHPFHLVNNGIRVDYDRHLGKNHWIQIGPQFYAADKSDEESLRDFNELIGAGISVNHRMYVGEQNLTGEHTLVMA
ncbi:MAG: hypothetical protein HC905_30280 [Bacteroidales bacterium]|nr:hypothetical protein [Bacteroidales bacterium]